MNQRLKFIRGPRPTKDHSYVFRNRWAEQQRRPGRQWQQDMEYRNSNHFGILCPPDKTHEEDNINRLIGVTHDAITLLKSITSQLEEMKDEQ